MRIGIMGGTFNPIHNAHLLLGELAKEEYKIDRLLFMPGGNPPHKRDKQIVSAEHRMNMCRLAIEDNPDFTLCDYEIKKDGYSYTVETLEHFKKTYPDDELFFIIGGDSLFAFEKWYCPEKILTLTTLLVFDRTGSGEDISAEIDRLKKKYNADINLIHAPKFDISSSGIRERIKEGKTVRYMTASSVIDYIEKHGLYKD